MRIDNERDGLPRLKDPESPSLTRRLAQRGTSTLPSSRSAKTSLWAPIEPVHARPVPRQVSSLILGTELAHHLAMPRHRSAGVLLVLSLLGAACSESGGTTDDAQATGGSNSGGQPSGGTGGLGGNDTGGQPSGGSGGLGGGNTGGSGATNSGGGTSGGGGQTSGTPACEGTSGSVPTLSCRDVSDCGGAPVKCCTSGNCWPDACPIPPTNCPTTFDCTTNADCAPNGTCVSTIEGCPRCEHRECVYPLPACTQTPDNCGPIARCQADGTCKPLLCDDGYECPTGTRCKFDSARADAHGCEKIPCNDGWSCDENTRCTAPTDAAPHGCTALSCSTDADCDCGFCVNSLCQSNLGVCSYPPA